MDAEERVVSADKRVIVALDVNSIERAAEIVAELAPYVECFKIGLEFEKLMCRMLIAEPSAEKAVQNLRDVRTLFSMFRGGIFYDAKLSDIPNTVTGAMHQLVSFPAVRMVTVHISSGSESMRAAVDERACTVEGYGQPMVFGVTALTSLSPYEIWKRYHGPHEFIIHQMVEEAERIGLDGIIAAPRDLEYLKRSGIGEELIKCATGIRPEWYDSKDDHERIMTPREAINAGADYLIVGRPILEPRWPVKTRKEAWEKIVAEAQKAWDNSPSKRLL